jgi:hypothetical protein
MWRITLLLLLCIQSFSIVLSSIILPFKTYYTSPLSSSNILQSIPSNFIGTEICLGTPKQCLILNIELQSPQIAIMGSSFSKFYETQSNTYNKGELVEVSRTEVDDFGDSIEIFNYTAYESSDTFYIKGTQEAITDFSFLNVDNNNHKGQFEINSGKIGFDRRLDKETENALFLKQMKKRNIIASYLFYLEYNEDGTSGNIVLGAAPHELNKQYKEEDKKETNSVSFGKYTLWGLQFDALFFDNQVLDIYLKKAIFSFENGFILAAKPFQDIILQKFFTNYITQGLCVEEHVSSLYETYSCIDDPKQVDFASFPNLDFYNSELNITYTLTYKDLFYPFEGKKYCLLYFHIMNNFDSYWILGKPFLKKYQIYFNWDAKTVGSYKIDNVTSSSGKNSWIIVLVCCVFCIAGLFFWYNSCKIKKIRKKRATELVEDYEYLPK